MHWDAAAMKPAKRLDSMILTIRGHKVLVDADLASIYGVTTKRLNEQVKRNTDRFPADFVYQLNAIEKAKVVANCDHLAKLKFAKALPYVFTEHGALMAAMVLNSPEAVAMSVYVVRAFVRMREQLAVNAAILKRLAEIDKALLEHNTALRDIYHKLMPLLQVPATQPLPRKRRIGFIADDE
jgi:hypothetical protein